MQCRLFGAHKKKLPVFVITDVADVSGMFKLRSRRINENAMTSYLKTWETGKKAPKKEN